MTKISSAFGYFCLKTLIALFGEIANKFIFILYESTKPDIKYFFIFNMNTPYIFDQLIDL